MSLIDTLKYYKMKRDRRKRRERIEALISLIVLFLILLIIAVVASVFDDGSSALEPKTTPSPGIIQRDLPVIPN